MNSRVCCVLLLGVLATALGGCLTQTSLDYYLKGQLAAQQGQIDTALTALDDAIEKNPRMGLAYMARGEVFKLKGQFEQAALDFLKVTSIEPYNFQAHYQLGLMYQYLKRFTDSIDAYQKAVAIRPLDPEANMSLASVYAQIGEPLRGLAYAQRAVQGDDNSAIAHANLGLLYSQNGEVDRAIDEYKKSIELDGRQSEVYLNLAVEFVKQSKFEQARNVLETAVAMGPSAAVSERLGVCYYKLGNMQKATEAYSESLRQNPNYHLALNGLGVVAMTRSLKTTPPNVDLAKEAVAYWHRSLALQPEQPAIQQLVKKYAGTQ